jgi:AraC-like DNA-binding protein
MPPHQESNAALSVHEEKPKSMGILPSDSGFLRVSGHEFRAVEDVPCGNSFADAGLHLCLNLTGIMMASAPAQKIPEATAFWVGGGRSIAAVRQARMSHHFLILSMDPAWLVRLFQLDLELVHPELRRFFDHQESGQILRSSPLQPGVLQIARLLDTAGPAGPGRPLWLQSQLLEILSLELFPVQPTITVSREQRKARDVVARVCVRLRQDLEHPPSLNDLAREVGCSPYHLSRLFSKEMGQTMSQYLRHLRLEEAAKLLRSGRFNVTETALEVGYSSLSHFSKAFAEHFGVNPYRFAAVGEPAAERNLPSKNRNPQKASEAPDPLRSAFENS